MKQLIAQTKDNGNHLMLKKAVYNQINSEIRVEGVKLLKLDDHKDKVFERAFFDYTNIESIRIYRSIKLSLVKSFKNKDTILKHIISFKKAQLNMKKIRDKITVRARYEMLEQPSLSTYIKDHYFKLIDIIEESIENITVIIDLIQDIPEKLEDLQIVVKSIS
jgi:hypothetical protein